MMVTKANTCPEASAQPHILRKHNQDPVGAQRIMFLPRDSVGPLRRYTIGAYAWVVSG